MRSTFGALIIPVLLSAAVAQAQAQGKFDSGSESPVARPAVPPPTAATVQQLAPGQAIPLGILPASPGGDPGQTPTQPVPSFSAAATPAIADWIGRSYTVPQRTEIFSAPDGNASSSGSLAEGADAEVVGVLEGRDWLKVRLPDGSFGYVRSASIPAVTGQAAAQPTPQPTSQPSATASSGVGGDIYVGGPIQGPAAVHDTATLVVNERALPLYAVDGFGGEPALAMQQYVDGEGRAVKCDPLQAKGFVCTLQDGTDVAKAALVNGAARVTPDAPPEYLAQQEDAKKAKRGIWRDGADKVDAVPYSRDAAGPVILSDSFVPGVHYPGPNGAVPAAFRAAGPVNGLAIIGDQPFTLADGDPTPILYRPGVGWGFWDRYFVWRRVPAAWIPRLEQVHPHGTNLHQVNLVNYGFVQSQPYFLGPAVDASFIPNQPPVVIGYGPYPSPVFAPYLDPGYVAVGAAAAIGLAGIVGGALPPPGGYGPGRPGGFRPPPLGFGPGGFGPGGFGPGGFGHPPGFGPPGGPGRMAGFGGPGPHFGGPMGGPPGGHFGGPMMGGPGRGAFGVRPVGGPGMMGGGFGRPGGMPMGMGGRPGGMPMAMGGRPGGMPMGRPGGMPMGGGRPGGMMMGGGAPHMGGFGGGGGRPPGGGGGAVHMAGGAPGRHH